MITITERAQVILGEKQRDRGTVCVLYIHWDRGISDNHRTESGENKWYHSGPRGWQMMVFGHKIEKGLDGFNEVAPGIYADVVSIGGPQFPGGVVDAEGEKVVFRANAV